MTNDQKKVAAGAASGIFAMLVGLVALSGIIAGLAADAGAGERLAYAFKWIAAAALPLALAIASVGNARFKSEAIDPTAGKENAAMIVNGRVVDNTVQQYLLFAAASLAVAAGARGEQLGVVAAGAIMFIVLRLAFWIGYRIKPVYR
ncbi:MAG TPA: MAPEG family protein, partial [Sphingomicrobium sp.]|nr:MAPEG family protein [Sphingomicrobium sp.]